MHLMKEAKGNTLGAKTHLQETKCKTI